MVQHSDDHPSAEQVLHEKQLQQRQLHEKQLHEKQRRFMALLEPYHTRLSSFAHALSQNTEDGRDLLAETILQAFEGMDKLRSDDAFRSYIFTIARRLHYRQLRRKKWWGVFDRNIVENIPDNSPADPDSKLDTRLLDQAIAKLPKKQREAVILFEISGFSLEEIREIQGGSISGVKSRIVRGRERLTKMLTETDKLTPLAPPSGSGRSMQLVEITLLREDII